MSESNSNGHRTGDDGRASALGPRYKAAALGFRNYWYPGMLSRHLGKKPVGIKLLGENLVFFRANGKAYALHDLCAHRGVPLSLGTCLAEGTVTCGYHGWTYDVATGKCVAALTDGPDSPAAGRYSVKTYPVDERGGIVFVYMGDGDPPPLEADVPEEALRPDWTQQTVVSVWHGNWRAAVENGYDAGHAPYVHRNSLRWRTAGSLQPAWSSVAGSEEIGPYLRQKRGKAGPPEADYPAVGHWPRYSWLRRFLAKVGKRPGRERPYPNEFRLPCMIHNKYFYYTHIRWAVPVDEHTTRNFQVYAGPFTGTRGTAFKVHYWLWHRWVFHMMFNGQDQWIVEALDYEAPERLYRPDASIRELRQYIETHARTGPVTATAGQATAATEAEPKEGLDRTVELAQVERRGRAK